MSFAYAAQVWLLSSSLKKKYLTRKNNKWYGHLYTILCELVHTRLNRKGLVRIVALTSHCSCQFSCSLYHVIYIHFQSSSPGPGGLVNNCLCNFAAVTSCSSWINSVRIQYCICVRCVEQDYYSEVCIFTCWDRMNEYQNEYM
jgi:hypothetical protein